MVAKKGRVEMLIVGSTAPSEKGGSTVFVPSRTHTTPRMIIRIDGMMPPRITPIFENLLVTSGPASAIRVVPQKAAIMTTNI